MENQEYHIPALLPQVLDGLDIKADGTYIDVTFGGGGHSRAIMERLSQAGHLYSMDQDTDAVSRAWSDPRFTIVHGNFKFMRNYMRYYGVGDVDGILADLGVSFHHFDDPDRGFSFRWDGVLDMRMNRAATLDATKVLNEYTEQQLADIFYLFGELKNARKLAAAIVTRRTTEPIATIDHLRSVITPFINPRQEKKELAQIFQALRIEVNNEIEALKALLTQSIQQLKPGGRLAIITYHSLEDRLVKNFMKTGNIDGRMEKDFYGRIISPVSPLYTKPIVADDDEVARNPRSRSAKLRIAVKL